MKIDKKAEKRKLQTRLRHAAQGIDMGYKFASFLYEKFCEESKDSVKVTKSIMEYTIGRELEHGAFTSYRNYLEGCGWISLKDVADRSGKICNMEASYWKAGPEFTEFINSQTHKRSKENSERIEILEKEVSELKISMLDKDLTIQTQGELIKTLQERIKELEKDRKDRK